MAERFIWIVGRLTEDYDEALCCTDPEDGNILLNRWLFTGAYNSEDIAIDACIDETFFYFKTTLKTDASYAIGKLICSWPHIDAFDDGMKLLEQP